MKTRRAFSDFAFDCVEPFVGVNYFVLKQFINGMSFTCLFELPKAVEIRVLVKP